MNKLYLNLTNGIELLHDKIVPNNLGFIRIQSTACEQHLWDNIIQDLDYHFLIDLAIGKRIIIWDGSNNKSESRALYQGVKFIEYTLNRIWFDKQIDIYVKDINCRKYFEEEYQKLSSHTIKKLKYVKKFLNTDTINIETHCIKTKHDGDYDWYKKVLIENY